MNFSALFIKRPVTTTILMLALVIMGVIAFFKLPISELPDIDFPTLMVSATLPGADPETMASAVATPLEKQLSTVSGLDSMSSVSSAGSTRITLQFDLSRNIDAAAQDVQSALLQATRHLPSNMPDPPYVRKVNPADSPVLYLALTANRIPLTKLDNLAENQIAPTLSMASGVAGVNVYGAQQYAVRIHLNPYALDNRHVSIDEVANAISQLNSNQPNGTLQTDGYYRLIKVNGQLENANAYNNAIVASRDNVPIRLHDIGHAVDSIANDKAATWFNNKRAIVLAVTRQPGANTVAVVAHIKKLLPGLEKELPAGASFNIVYDRSVFIHHSINDIQYTLLFAVLLVIAVVFLFFGSLKSTVITVLSLPVSIIATFAMMYLLGYGLDNLSLMGLVLAVGFVIDDSIVVLENIMRHFEAGKDKLTASLIGSKEITFTVISMTVSLVAVFIPIFFMQGLIGRLFHEFGAVVGISILISGIVSLTLIPMLSSRFLRHKPTTLNKPSFINNNFFERGFEYCRRQYVRSLTWSVAHQRLLLTIALGILAATAYLFFIVPKGFIPSQDANILFGTVKAPQGVTYHAFMTRQQKAAAIIANDPNVADLISSVGQGSGGTVSTNTGRFTIRLKPKQERSQSADQIIHHLRRQLSQIAGLKVFLSNPSAIRIGGRVSSGNYEYVLQSADWETLKKTADVMKGKLAKIHGIRDVDSDLSLNNPELSLHILRDKAAQLGITPAQIENTLYAAYGERQVTHIMKSGGDYNVILDIDPTYQINRSDLALLSLKSSNGQMIPLTSVVTVNNSAGPLSVSHSGQLPSIALSFDLQQGISLGSVTSQIKNMAEQTLPAQVTGEFAGAAQTFQASLHTLPLLLLFTILVIYGVLAILYEHFGHPITILTALPFAGFGALLSLCIFHQELNIFSFIGLIMLVGLTKKNGIIMVDFALAAKRQEKISDKEAIIKACSIRFRPIMMTTVSAVVATLPIALGIGAGGETRKALGITVVGGLIFSQLITLYITPVFYLLMSKWRIRKKPLISDEGVMLSNPT